MTAELTPVTYPDLLTYHLPIRGVELIKQFSECHLQSYLAPGAKGLNSTDHTTKGTDIGDDLTTPQPPTYLAGWGSLRNKNGRPFAAGEQLTQAQANELLYIRLQEVVLPTVAQLAGWHDLNEHQQGALLSFAHSLGDDLFPLSPQLPLARAMRDRRPYLIPDILENCYGSGTTIAIDHRRKAEADLFQLEIRRDSYTVINRTRQLDIATPFLKGQDVQALQQALVRYGYEIEPDSVFGPVTQWAVEKFQAAAGLPINGVADVQTQRILHARALYLNDPYLIGSDVREVQSQLSRIGYDVRVDGIFGLQTWRAVITFQQYFSLPDNGVVQAKTLAKLLYLPVLAIAS